MRIVRDFIGANPRITILSNEGQPNPVPVAWRPVLDTCEILIAIPDMHMYIHGSTLDNFKYGALALLDFLMHLAGIKAKLAAKRKILRIYQIGDLYELRFPSVRNSGANVMPDEISLSHSLYSEILNTLDSLRTHYVYGNHDFELRHYGGYRFGAVEGKVRLEHGFAADTWMDFANPNRPLWEPSQLVFKTIRELESFFGSLLVAASVIKRDDHFAVGVASGATERGDFPAAAEYTRKHPHQKQHYEKRLTDPPADEKDVRICVIAHTHDPYLDATVGGGDHILIDAGAWTEGRSDFAVITNEEVAVCRYAR